MSRLRYNWAEAKRFLRANCPPMRQFIDQFGAARYPVRRSTLFQALSRSIAYQQLSGKAAGTIYGRFEALFEDGQPNAAEVLNFDISTLRGVGLSQAKSLSIIDLASRQQEGLLPTPRKMASLNDDQIIDDLCQVRGIGPWTAQMYLIFYLGRPDVMPATDLAIQKGVRNIYRLGEMPSPAELMQVTAHLEPFRSAASWYFWRASEADEPLA